MILIKLRMVTKLLIQFPIQGEFREILIVIEMLIVVLNIQFGIIYFNRFIKQKGTKNYLYLGWTILFSCFAITFFSFIIGDFYTSSDYRSIFLNFGYIFTGSGEILLSFYAERELKSKNYIITIIISSLLLILVVNLIFNFIVASIISIFFWVLFLVLLIMYSNKFISKIEQKRRLRLNVYGFVTAASITILGWAGISDLGTAIFGIFVRLIGDIFIITGMTLISLLFLGLPRLSEINWMEKVNSLYIMHNSGRALYNYSFKEEKDLDEDAFDSRSQLIAGGLTSVTQVISNLIQSKEKLEIVDHGDKKIMFEYGDYTINVLIVDEILDILRIKLKNLTKDIETLYQNQLDSWDGDVDKFSLLKSITQQHFVS